LFLIPGPLVVPELGSVSPAGALAAAGLGAALADRDDDDAPPPLGEGRTDGMVAEIADGSPGEGAAILEAEGEFPFLDKDENVHQVVVSLVSAEDSVLGTVGARGALTATVGKASDVRQGIVSWRF